MALGWSPTVVTSGSMAPSLNVGDVVHIDNSVDLGKLGAGSVIAFDDPGIPGMRVTHRVTGVEFEGGTSSDSARRVTPTRRPTRRSCRSRTSTAPVG